MSTFTEALAADAEQIRWRFYFTIDGVGAVFGMSAADTAVFETETGRTHLAGIRGVPQFSGDQLNYRSRAVVGGTFTAEVLDDDALSLAALVVPRSRRSTFVTANANRTTTTLTVKDSSVFTLPCDIYVDGETMRATAAPTATTLTVVRGKYGSEAQPHRGGTEQGASVFAAPRRWKGRRVRVWGYLVDSQGRATTGRRLQFGTWMLKAAPTSLSPRRWRFEGVPLLDDFARRKLGEGIQDSATAYRTLQGSTLLVENGSWSEVSTRFSYALVRFERETAFAVRNVESVTLYDNRAEVTLGDVDRAIGSTGGRNIRRVKSARHICILDGGDPGVLLLFALASRTGDGTNGTYDVLPGLEPADYGEGGYRMGAGIPSAELDAAGIIAAMVAAPPHALVIDDSIVCGDLLTDVALLTGSVAATTRDGQLTLLPLAEDETASVLTLTSRHLRGPVQVTYDDAGIMPRLRLRANYNAMSREHEGNVVLIDQELVAEAANDEAEVELSTRLLTIAPAAVGPDGAIQLPTVSIPQVEPALRRYQVASGRGRLLLTGSFNHEAMALRVGDVVTIGFSASDLAGGDVLGSTARVAAWTPTIEQGGTVQLTLEVLDRLFVVAPGFRVKTWDSGTLEIAFTADPSPEYEATSAPARCFYVGQELSYLEAATDTLFIVEVASIVDDQTLTVVADPGFTAAAAGDVLFVAGGTHTLTTANTFGYDEGDYLRMQPDEGGTDYETRWR